MAKLKLMRDSYTSGETSSSPPHRKLEWDQRPQLYLGTLSEQNIVDSDMTQQSIAVVTN